MSEHNEFVFFKKDLNFKTISVIIPFVTKRDADSISNGRLAQLGERSLDVRKVAGSIPVPSIKKVFRLFLKTFLCLTQKGRCEKVYFLTSSLNYLLVISR